MIADYLSVQCCFCVKPGGQSFFRCCKHPARPEDGLGGCWNVKGQVHQEMKEVKFTTTTDYQGPVRYVKIEDWDTPLENVTILKGIARE